MADYDIQSDTRTIRAQKNIIIMVIIKGLSLLISLAYVPLLLNSLNSTNYGIWLTLTSLVSWVAMFDVGLGHGLRNKLSEALARGNVHLGKQYVSTAYVGICLVMIFFLIVFFLVSNNFLSWTLILNAPDLDKDELTQLVNIVFVAFGANFILSLINSVFFALQMPAFSTMLTVLGQLFSFVVVYLLTSVWQISSLLVLGTAISIIPVVILLLTTLILFNTRRYRDIAPSIYYFQFSKLREILSLGVNFFIIQIIKQTIY